MTTPLLVTGANTLEAWRAGAAAIVNRPKGELFSLVTAIDSAAFEDRALLSRVNGARPAETTRCLALQPCFSRSCRKVLRKHRSNILIVAVGS
jgi:hypothetical protein